MKKFTLALCVVFIPLILHAQNYIGIQIGYLFTHTSIAEYERIERNNTYLLDSMTVAPDVSSAQVSLYTDIGLGMNFFLSAGFTYADKGLKNVVFTDSTGWPWQTAARQKYAGISAMLGYRFQIPESRFGLTMATGPKVDFAVGTPNAGALFSAPYFRFFNPICRFNEVELSWMAEVGASYRLGPGDINLKINYFYGLSDVLEDAFVIGRTMSGGITVGYSFRLFRSQ
jgi:hypothetical protein